MQNYSNIADLLNSKAEITAKINLFPYQGTPEVKVNKKGDKYLYVRRREFGHLKSTYVGKYSDELYKLLLRNAKELHVLKKSLRAVEKELLQLGYTESELSTDILRNIEFARINLKSNIYDQAVLEGVATTFPQTETIIDNGKVHGVSSSDVQKILNLKHAWEFILDQGVIQSKSDYNILCYIAKLVNEGFFADGGKIRNVPVKIGGTDYIPVLPLEAQVKEDLLSITNSDESIINNAIELCLYCMKSQIFLDGNKRAAIIFACHYLIAHGEGLLVIPKNQVEYFKKLLIQYYEGRNVTEIKQFLKEKCWQRIK